MTNETTDATRCYQCNQPLPAQRTWKTNPELNSQLGGPVVAVCAACFDKHQRQKGSWDKGWVDRPIGETA